MNDVSVVIPVFNASERIEELVSRVLRALRREGYIHEVILVNDFSDEETRRSIDRAAKKYKNTVGMHLPFHQGQQAALALGIEVSSAKWVVTLDDDFEHLPEEIPRLLNALKNGSDLVYATAVFRKRSLLREKGSATFLACLGKFAGFSVRPGGFRAFEKRLWQKSHSLKERKRPLDLQLLKASKHATNTLVRFGKSRRGVSSYTLKGLMIFAVRAALGSRFARGQTP
jgi:polyisoprenyl-phosphate glycosyltransferase